MNLSYTQLQKPDFVDMVLRILTDLDYPPECLCLEVTERCRLLDLELLKNVVASLKARGILIALDDFGTGFSSIGILKEILFKIIKIDRSFVQMIEENEVDRQIVRSIADLASVFSATLPFFPSESLQLYDARRGCAIGVWVRRRCFLEPWVQNGCIIRFRDAPMQYAYAPMGKNGCIEEKESPAANLLAVSKKATGLSSFTLFQL